MKLQRLICLCFLVLFSFIISSSKAYKFYVGGKYGWVVNHSEDYNPWAERNRFQVGDSLFFKYEKGSNSVLLVNKDDYEKCYKKNPIKKFEDGNTVFQIDRSGPYFFISGKDDNCEKGQKLIVVVLAIRSPPPPQTPSTPKAPSPFVLTPSQSPSPSVPISPISQPPYISAPPTTTPSPISEPPSSQADNPISQPPNTYSPDSQPPLAAQTPRGSIIAPAYSPSTQTSLSPYANSPSSTPSVTTPATSPVSDSSPPPPSPPSSSSSNETAPAPPNRTSFAWAVRPSWLWVYSVITIIVGFALTTNLG